MLHPGSRYEDARTFDPSPPGIPELLRPRDIEPTEDVLEHTLARGHRADTLAIDYYGEPRLWYRVLDSNPQIVCASDLESEELEGHILVIPRRRS